MFEIFERYTLFIDYKNKKRVTNKKEKKKI